MFLSLFRYYSSNFRPVHSFPTRRSSDLSIERHGHAEEYGPLARLHRLAAARCATLDRPAETERVQPQIERDEQADEREERDRLAVTHQRRCGRCATILSARALKSSEPGRRRNSSFLPFA